MTNSLLDQQDRQVIRTERAKLLGKPELLPAAQPGGRLVEHEQRPDRRRARGQFRAGADCRVAGCTLKWPVVQSGPLEVR
jgi:hypothetical protein